MRQIIINSTAEETRVALMEASTLLEVFIERSRAKGIAGNLYKGRVTRVMPGMQAAFVDIGVEKAAFLHASDHRPEFGTAALVEDVETAPPAPAARERPPIENVLRRGNEIVVQVAKEPMGGKGARVTSQITLPGRCLIYLPHAAEIGVSRRIDDPVERQRLREIVTSLRPRAGGVIVRTSAEGLTKREIAADLRFLTRLWERIAERAHSEGAPALLHYDMDLVLRVARDILTGGVQRVFVDSARDHHRIVSFLESAMPKIAPKVDLHDDPEPIFERFRVEPQIRAALERVVRLKSGGTIAIDPTEALTAIDVNTGRYVGKEDLDQTALETNLEAARAIAAQLRLRNIGGLIVIDFIDMRRAADQRRVVEALSAALRKDDARTNVLGLSALGLVEMTRRRTRESLAELLSEPCRECRGRGRVVALSAVAYEILRRVKSEARRNPNVARFKVVTRPEVAEFLTVAERGAIEQLERDTGRPVTVDASANLPPDRPFEVVGQV